jgi:uncharacterized protein (TIGR03083 family)
MVIEAYLSAAATAGDLLRSPALPPAWTAPSALEDFRVSGLAGHLARGVFTLEKYLDTPPPGPDTRLIDAATYLIQVADLSPEDNLQVRERGEVEAEAGPQELIDRYDAAVARLRPRLAALAVTHPVPMVGGNVLPLGECLVTRLVELLVHSDDLAVSIGVPSPEFDEAPADLVVSVLSRFARRRHGTAPVLRALARQERAFGSIAAF